MTVFRLTSLPGCLANQAIFDRSAGTQRSAVPELSVNNMIAAINVERLARDQARGIMRQKGSRRSDIVNAHEATYRRLGLGQFKQLVKLRNSGRSACRQGTRRNRMHPNAL